MLDFSVLMGAVLPVYLLAALGIFLRWRRVLTSELDRGLFRLVIHFLYPCLILDKLMGNEQVADVGTVVISIGAGFGLVLAGFAVAWLVAELFRLRVGTGKRSLVLGAGVQNYGYVAIPLIGALFASDEALGVLFMHSLGVELAIWTVGLMIMTGSMRLEMKHFLNGPIIAVVVGLLLVATGADAAFPREGSGLAGVLGGSVRTTMSWLGACAVPVAVILIGATMAEVWSEVKFSTRVSGAALLARTAIMPVIILWVASWAMIPRELQMVLVIQAAMPAAVTPIIITRHYGGHTPTTVEAVAVTSIVGMITIPLIIQLGFWWLGW